MDTQTDPIDLLLIAIVQALDAESAENALNERQLFLDKLPSTGGFLGQKNVTLLLGAAQDHEANALDILQKTCHPRTEYISMPFESAPVPLPAPIAVRVGGATIFTLVVERYEEF